MEASNVGQIDGRAVYDDSLRCIGGFRDAAFRAIAGDIMAEVDRLLDQESHRSVSLYLVGGTASTIGGVHLDPGSDQGELEACPDDGIPGGTGVNVTSTGAYCLHSTPDRHAQLAEKLGRWMRDEWALGQDEL